MACADVQLEEISMSYRRLTVSLLRPSHLVRVAIIYTNKGAQVQDAQS